MSNLYETSAKLAVPSDLDDASRVQIAQSINSVVADVFALFLKTKNFHWHLSGSRYRDYHLLLDEQSDELFAMIDVLAERVRKLGKNTIHSLGEITKLQTIDDNNDDFVEPKAMMQELMDDNKKLAQSMRAAHEVCSVGRDVGTTSVLENFIDETERRTWFLFEIQIS